MSDAIDLSSSCGRPSPCPWRSCRHHMALAALPDRGPIASSRRVRLALVQPETCALKHADRGPLTLEETGLFLAMDPSAVRKVQNRATRKLARKLGCSVEEAIERLKGLAVLSWVERNRGTAPRTSKGEATNHEAPPEAVRNGQLGQRRQVRVR